MSTVGRTLLCVAAMVSSAAAAPPAVTIEHTAVVTETGERVPYDHGLLQVRENRDDPTSKTIAISFSRLPATKPTGAPPIVFLPGGPGANYDDAFTGATENARRRLAMFRRYAEAAEVIVMDTRGQSPRGDSLVQPAVRPRPAQRPSSVADAIGQWKAYAADAIVANRGHDLAGYTIVQVAADVDELRAALGYRTISLLGGSFGSQTCFAMMRLYPTTIARAVLSAVEPIDHGFDMPTQVMAALERIAADADRAPELAPYLPPGGVMAAVRALIKRFEAGPVRVTIPGEREPVVLGLEDLQSWLVPDDDAADWPAFVLTLYRGHYEDWAKKELASRRGPLFTTPINPLIDSSIGASPARIRELRADPAQKFLGDWQAGPHLGSRAAWPTKDIGELRAFVRSDIPLVMIQGDWDTSTPIENMQTQARYFTHAHTIAVHRGEHAPPSRLAREDPAAFAAIVEFFRSGSTTKLPHELTLATPRFTLPAQSLPR